MSDFSKRIIGNWDGTDTTGTDFDFSSVLDKNALQQNPQNSTSLTDLNKSLQTQNSINSDYFSAKNLGSTLSSVGAVGSALANVYGMYEQKKYNKDMLNMEKDRVNKENMRRDTQQAEYDKVWKTN